MSKKEEITKEEKVELKEEIKELKKEEKDLESEIKTLEKKNKELETLIHTLQKQNDLKDTKIEEINRDYVVKLSQKMNEANNTLKEKVAEINNKKNEEVALIKKYAIEKPASELIDIISQFEGALSHTPSDEKVLNYQRGFNMFLGMFKNLLADLNINEISANVGDEYDSQFMQAADSVEDSKIKQNHIVKIISKGYKLHDRIIKPIIVIISK